MRPCRVFISESALIHNLKLLRKMAPQSHFWCVVKADAYGHGLEIVAEALAPHTEGFAVATLAEAVCLREQGIKQPILLLEGLYERAELQTARALDVHLVVHQPQQLDWLARLPEHPWQIWLKVDTGMHRLGVPVSAFSAFYQAVRAALPRARLHVMSHLSCADEPQDAYTSIQFEQFQAASAALNVPRSLANSAALIRYPHTHFEWVRPGIALYGATSWLQDSQPVMRFQSEVIARKTVSAGACVGYGCSWRATQTRQLAVVAAGYGDGYPREVKQAQVWLAGAKAPVVGRISMDMLTIDITAHPQNEQIHPGTQVELWGTHIPVTQVAQWADTISYTLLCGIQQRVRREKTS